METRARVTALTVAAVLSLALADLPTAAQETGTFTLTQNGNQVATEAFTRTSDHLKTQLTVPGQALILTDATLTEDAMVSRLEIRVLPPGSGPDGDPIQTTAASFGPDSVHVEQPIGTAAGGLPAVRGTVPYLNPSPSHMEQIIRRARALGGKDVAVQVWAAGRGVGQVVEAQVAFHDDGGATLSMGGTPIELELDAQGRLIHGEVASQNLVIERQ